MAMKKYKYNGTTEVHLPQQAMTVHPGDIIEVTEAINHPDFELVEKETKTRKK